MLEGPVANCLLELARERRVDLIIVGTHGRGGLGKVFLGSVAEKVFRHSPVPVLTVGPNIRGRSKHPELRNILAPCDLAARSHRAVHYSCSLAASQHSRLTVLHVAEPAGEGMKIDPEHLEIGIRERLAEIVGDAGHNLDVNYRVEVGSTAATIERRSQLESGPDCAGSAAFLWRPRSVYVACGLRIGSRCNLPGADDSTDTVCALDLEHFKPGVSVTGGAQPSGVQYRPYSLTDALAPEERDSRLPQRLKPG